MQYHEIVDHVAKRAEISRDDAYGAVDATVAALGRELSLEEAHDMASQLPRELKDVLRPIFKGSAWTDQPMGRDEFLEHVARRADVPLDRAEDRARAVLAVLHEALSDGEWADICARLPESITAALTTDAGARR